MATAIIPKNDYYCTLKQTGKKHGLEMNQMVEMFPRSLYSDCGDLHMDLKLKLETDEYWTEKDKHDSDEYDELIEKPAHILENDWFCEQKGRKY